MHAPHTPETCPTFVCDVCELPAFVMTPERVRDFVAHVLMPASWSDPTALLWLCDSAYWRSRHR